MRVLGLESLLQETYIIATVNELQTRQHIILQIGFPGQIHELTLISYRIPCAVYQGMRLPCVNELEGDFVLSSTSARFSVHKISRQSRTSRWQVLILLHIQMVGNTLHFAHLQ